MYNLGRFDRMKPFYKMGLPFPSRMFYNGQFTGERDRLYWYVINSYESKDRYLFDMAVPCLYWTRDAMYYRNFAFHLKQEQFQSYLQYFHKMFYFVAVNQKLHFYDLYDYSMLEPSIFNGIGN